MVTHRAFCTVMASAARQCTDHISCRLQLQGKLPGKLLRKACSLGKNIKFQTNLKLVSRLLLLEQCSTLPVPLTEDSLVAEVLYNGVSLLQVLVAGDPATCVAEP